MTAGASTKRAKPRRDIGPDGFDIVFEQVVGHVEFGNGDMHPHVAAFKAIGEHGEPGTYRFPREDGSVAVVAVEHEGGRD